MREKKLNDIKHKHFIQSEKEQKNEQIYTVVIYQNNILF